MRQSAKDRIISSVSYHIYNIMLDTLYQYTFVCHLRAKHKWKMLDILEYYVIANNDFILTDEIL